MGLVNTLYALLLNRKPHYKAKYLETTKTFTKIQEYPVWVSRNMETKKPIAVYSDGVFFLVVISMSVFGVAKYKILTKSEKARDVFSLERDFIKEVELSWPGGILNRVFCYGPYKNTVQEMWKDMASVREVCDGRWIC